MGETIGTDYVNDFLFELYRSREQQKQQQDNVESIINLHITKIVSGLSNSDW